MSAVPLLRRETLKKDVIHVLKQHPDGVLMQDIWNILLKTTGRHVSARDYGVPKMSQIFTLWTNEIETFYQSGQQFVRLRRQFRPEEDIQDKEISSSVEKEHEELWGFGRGRGMGGNFFGQGPLGRGRGLLGDGSGFLGASPRFAASSMAQPLSGPQQGMDPQFPMGFFSSSSAMQQHFPTLGEAASMSSIEKSQTTPRSSSIPKPPASSGSNSNVTTKTPQKVESDSSSSEDSSSDEDSDDLQPYQNPRATKQQIRENLVALLRKNDNKMDFSEISKEYKKKYGTFNEAVAGKRLMEFLLEDMRDVLMYLRKKNSFELKTHVMSTVSASSSIPGLAFNWGSPATTAIKPHSLPPPGKGMPPIQSSSSKTSLTIDLTKEVKKETTPVSKKKEATPVPKKKIPQESFIAFSSSPPDTTVKPGMQQSPYVSGPRMSAPQGMVTYPTSHLQLQQNQGPRQFQGANYGQGPFQGANYGQGPFQGANYGQGLSHFQSQNQGVGSVLSDSMVSQLRGNVVTSSQVQGIIPTADDMVMPVRPIRKVQFEDREVKAAPVHLPDRCDLKYELENIARDCIELLADNNEYVSSERIEKLLLQRCRVRYIKELNLRYIDNLSCVYEHNRLISKVNAYIFAFIKTRGICTLYELRECMREFAPNNGDFSDLKLGPIQRLPVVYQQFKFPPDQAEIPEITTVDVLEHFRNYMTKYNKWQSGCNIEEFLNFMVDIYSAGNAYYLGVRIRSLPLAAQVLKKAQRDAGSNRRQVYEAFKDQVKSEIEAAFRKFRSTILQAGSGTEMEVRNHYLKTRPEIAVMEIFEKFRLLMVIDQPTLGKDKRQHSKLNSAIQEFLLCVRDHPLAKTLMHLAICVSNTALEESAMERLKPGKEQKAESDSTPQKQPPRKDALLDKLKTYIERCINAGALSLAHLDRIEEKLLDDFEFPSFSGMGFGRFLQFLLQEAKHMLEESGGTVLGSSGGSSEGEVGFKPQQNEVLEFVKQSVQCGLTQPAEIEQALCSQYVVKDVRHLGYGNIARLQSSAEKHGKHQSRDFTVLFEAALVAKSGNLGSASATKVGILGHQTREATLACLHNCPLLENLAEWSQWSLIFEPEHGKLRDFIQKYGGCRTINLEGGKKTANIDILALEMKPGHLMKITGHASPQLFAAALEMRDVTAACGQLVSLAVASKGVHSMPLALITNHMKSALFTLHAGDKGEEGTPGAPPSADVNFSLATDFVMKCLMQIPTRICVALANQVFLEPLGQVIGSTRSKVALMQSCKTVAEVCRMQELGCLLGISEWTKVLQQKSVFPDSVVHIIPTDMGDEFYDDSLVVIDDDESDESDSESQASDIGSILSIDDSSEEASSAAESQEEAKTEKIGEKKETEKETKKEKEESKEEEKSEDRKDEVEVPEVENEVKEKVKKKTEEKGKETEEADTTKSEEKDIVVVKAEVESEVEISDDEGEVIEIGSTEDDSRDAEMKEDAREEPPETKKPEIKEPTCEDIINQIRRDEFGIGVELNEDGLRLMKVQQERLGRSLDRLSKDLYSKDTHFVLELVQNADDNKYPDHMFEEEAEDLPSVKFIINEKGIMVLNNECGFRENDIRALCDVGRSTKGKHKFGYIGQKGIGFKSVFRVTDAPEVHSSGYHICFDVKSGPMGYILPHWKEDEWEAEEGWITKIVLPLKETMVAQTRTLAARFNDIHPSLLLFLHRLRELTVENKVEGVVQTMKRTDMGDNVIKIEHSDGVDSWLVVKKMLDASKISAQAKSGVDVESTEIALAFQIKTAGLRSQVLPPKQPVFAFLPLRSYGFRFIIQGDFDVPSSREDVDKDSSWNQWIRSEIHTLFIEALEAFKTHKDLNQMEAVSMYLQFVPIEDEVLDFFKPVAMNILQNLRGKPCVPTQPNSRGVIAWKIPSQTVRVRDPLVREVITPDLLQKHLNLFYLHTDLMARLNPTLSQCLGIEELTTDHLIQIGKALTLGMGDKVDAADIWNLSRWFACIYRSLDEFQQNEAVLTTIHSMKVVPLLSGELVSLSEKTVFFPTDINAAHQNDPLSVLQRDLCSVHPGLLKTKDAEVNSQVQKILHRMGIRPLTPPDIVNYHIMPVFKSEAWKSKGRDVLVAYLIFLKRELETQPSLCNMDELKEVVQLVTNHGIKNPSQEPIHFTPLYGNKINLEATFPGYAWILIDVCYLPPKRTQFHAQSWHEFLCKLGVSDFLSVKKETVHLTKETLLESPWAPLKQIWPEREEYIIKDCSSKEMQTLIQANKFHGTAYQEQMRQLFEHIDAKWDSEFCHFTCTHVYDSQMNPIRDTETSFAIYLGTLDWLPAVQTKMGVDADGSVSCEKTTIMMQPSCLYVRSEKVQKYLAQNVLYLDARVSEKSSFSKFLRLKNNVTVETVKSSLLEWCHREKEDEPAVFCTSLDHMKDVYSFLSMELTRKDLQDLFKDHAAIFVPDKVSVVTSGKVAVAGKMLLRAEIWLEDATMLFDKYRGLLEEFHSDICKKRTIRMYYSDRQDIMRLLIQEARIDERPQPKEYAELLILLTSSSSVKDTKIRSDVLYLYSTIGQVLSTSTLNIPDAQTEMMILESQKHLVRNQLKKEKIFISKKMMWVGLDDEPMIADSKDLELIFQLKEGVHFLELDEKLSMQERRARNKAKASDSPVNKSMIQVFLDVFEIKNLSDCVKTEEITVLAEPCPKLQYYFYQVVPPLQRYLLVKYEQVYQQHVDRNIKGLLKDSTYFQVKQLEVKYCLKNRPDTFVIRQEKCIIKPPQFYFHRDHLDSMPEINKEVAKFFGAGNNDVVNNLRSFLSELSGIIKDRWSDEAVVDLLQRHDAWDTEEIPFEELWDVAPPPPPPSPPVIEEPPEVPAEPVQVEVTVDLVTTEQEGAAGAQGSDKKQDGVKKKEPQLRTWPPVAPEGGHREPREWQNLEPKPGSNIWPPPQAPDYMQSVRELPSKFWTSRDDETEPPVESGDGKGGHRGSSGTSRQDSTDSESRKRKLSENQEPGTKKSLQGERDENKSSEGETAEGKDKGAKEPVDQSDKPAGQKTRQGDIEMEDQRDRPGPKTDGESRSSRGPDDQRSYQGQSSGGGVKRRHETGDSDSPRAPSPKRTPVRLDTAVWTQLASEYTYEELGTGESLPIPANLAESTGTPEVGNWGETVVYHYLLKQRDDQDNILEVRWINESSETGLPYDFEVHYVDEDGIHVDYIEVKSTASESKEVFEISTNQVRFAFEKKNHFHIYRVFNAGQPLNVKLIKIDNLDMRMDQKQVKLCMMI